MRALILTLLALLLNWSVFAATAAGTTQAEIEAAITKAGTSAPDWWDAVKLNYPQTLDLTWQDPPPKTPWTPSKWLGQYVWSVINENPGKWKEGAKLLHHTLTVNKADAAKMNKSMKALGNLYHNMLQDHARAAYWWRKAGDPDNVGLAECYFKMGNKEMAKALLQKIGHDDTRHGSVIKLWADMGEYAKALAEAEYKAQHGMPDIGYLMAGDACRLAGKYTEAIAYYNKVIKIAAGGRDVKQSVERAKASIEAVTVYDKLDLKKIPDGKYSSSSYGYSGQVTVEVSVASSKIAEVKVTKHAEKQYYGSLTDTPAQIIAKQTVKGIDTFASATITSEAIINATAKALASGVK
jgi:uncharacterized protein with FMN-binding domain